MKRILFLAISILILAACTTKFSVNGEYDETPIVHMLLDPNDEFHFLKLNKTFLGDGNANDFAMVADSAYFDQVEATIEEVVNGSTIRSWTLDDTIIENKEPGTFYYPEQKLYFFQADDLNEDALYRLSIIIDNGKHVVKGQTYLLPNINISTPFTNTALNFAESNVPLNGYRSQPISFSQSITPDMTDDQEAQIYKVQILFEYVEHKPSGNEKKSILWDIGSVDLENTTSSVPSVSASGELFYEIVASRVEQDPDVTKRTIESFEILVTAGSEDLKTYMMVNEPTSSLAQNKPEYSNVEGGLGIFSSRNTIVQIKEFDPPGITPSLRGLSLSSTKELCQGQYTGDLLFCSDHEDDDNQPYYCN